MQYFLKYGIYSLNMDFDPQKWILGIPWRSKIKKMATKKTIMIVTWKIGPGVLQLFHAQLNSTIVGLLTFISILSTSSESLNTRRYFFQRFSLYEQLKMHA